MKKKWGFDEWFIFGIGVGIPLACVVAAVIVELING